METSSSKGRSLAREGAGMRGKALTRRLFLDATGFGEGYTEVLSTVLCYELLIVELN